MIEYNIGKIPFNDKKWSAGIAYVTIPSDIDRNTFISNCFKNGVIMLKTENGSVFKNVPCSVESFNYLYWPLAKFGYGSAVCYVTSEEHQQPIIVSILNKPNEIIDLNEDEWKIGRKFNSSNVEIRGSAKEGFLNITLQGSENSDLNIKIVNANNNSNFNIEVDGKFELLTSDNVTINSKSQNKLIAGNEKQFTEITQTDTEVNINSDKFYINEGKEQMVLGNKLKKLFDDFIDEVASTTVTTSLGQMPILNSLQVAAFKTKTNEILSQISYTD